MQGTYHPSICLPLTSTLLSFTVVGKIVDPLGCPNHWHVNVLLYIQKKTLYNVVKVKNLEMGDYPTLFR